MACLMELNIWAGDGDLWVSRLFHLQEIIIVVGINANIFSSMYRHYLTFSNPSRLTVILSRKLPS